MKATAVFLTIQFFYHSLSESCKKRKKEQKEFENKEEVSIMKQFKHIRNEFSQNEYSCFKKE